MKYLSKSVQETNQLGYEFAKFLNPGDVVALYGNLGSGKTQFVKGIASYFTIEDIINSPTFIIVNEYHGIINSIKKDITLYHFDLYRITSHKELEVIDFNNYINNIDSIKIIEWPEISEPYLNTEFHKIYLTFGEKENFRYIEY